jgi:hypothetical protein
VGRTSSSSSAETGFWYEGLRASGEETLGVCGVLGVVAALGELMVVSIVRWRPFFFSADSFTCDEA